MSNTTTNNEWLELSQQLHDELNVIKRDALVPTVIAQEPTVANERDLYEQLLIDVEMGSCGKASKVGEAISAAQLFWHRYFVNLETLQPSDPVATKKKLKIYWQWMKNYRVWEANRKVFLYPENYIRPELRDSKTPAFKTLEDDLLQGEITDETARRVYQKYLDEYTEVSRLTIAGGYVYDSKDRSGQAAKSLVLFGRTKTDPRRYYYRMAQFLGREKATTWEPWLKVETQIEADRVYPVFAFKRVFVFWAKIETISETPTSTSLTTTDDPVPDGKGKAKTQAIAAAPQAASHVLRIFYSFYNLNKEWVPAQTLRPKDEAAAIDIKIPAGIDIKDIKNIGLLVETATKLSVPSGNTGNQQGDHDNIIIQCTYDIPVTEYDLVLLPANQPLPKTGQRVFIIGKSGPDVTAQLQFRAFDHQEQQILDITDAAIADPTQPSDKLNQLNMLKWGLWWFWNGLVPMTSESKKKLLDIITQLTNCYPPRPEEGQARTLSCYRAFSLTPELYAVKLPNQGAFENVSQIFRSIFDEPNIPADQMVMFNTVQQSAEGPWFSFDHKGGSFLCKPDVGVLPGDLWPQYLPTNTDGLPKWSMIDAAVQLPARSGARKTFYFKNTAKGDRRSPQTYVSADTVAPTATLSAENAIRDFWGKIDNAIQTNGIVTAAYVHRDTKSNIFRFNGAEFAMSTVDTQITYLFSGNQYVAYTNNDASKPYTYTYVDEGFPQPITNHPSFPKPAPEGWTRVDAVFQGKDRKVYFFNNARNAYVVSDSNRERQIKEDWGTVTKSAFIKDFRPPADDPGAPAVDAAFVVGTGATATTYLINRSQYIKYTAGADYSLMAGEPKTHDFLELLIELGFNANSKTAVEQTALRAERVVAAYNQGADVYFHTKAGNNYEFKGGQLTLVAANKTVWSAGFEQNGVVYQFTGNRLTATTIATNAKEEATVALNISAAFAGADTDTTIYLFRPTELAPVPKTEYITVPKAGLTVQALVTAIAGWVSQPNVGQSSEEKWGKMGDAIARTGRIDAAFCDKDKTYLFSGNEYIIYSGNRYGSRRTAYPDAGYPKPLKTNTENFPQWDAMRPILQTLTADGSRGDVYYFDNATQTYGGATNPNFGTLFSSGLATRATWGRVKNNIAETGVVDAAFVKSDTSGVYLFLTSGDQIFRYTILTTLNPTPVLDATNKPALDAALNNVVDRGYPKRLRWERRRIDAAFTLAGKTYLVSDDHYIRLGDLRNGEIQELTRSPQFKPIRRNWGNLPQELIAGIDGALSAASEGVPGEGSAQDLYLFRGDRYIKYTIENANSPQPFELESVTYEIVRLTTSTAYRLNQAFFDGGLPQLLSLATQEIDDTPAFKPSNETISASDIATTIRVRPEKVAKAKLPSGAHLDFSSANGLYYWEIFFHAPFLIAQALNLGQQFDAAKIWYEYIYDPTGVFDPTSAAPYWKFLPFARNLPTLGEADQGLINAYLTDPFDPHAIAALRPLAYRKAIVMAYLDNLLDWGDMLFQQYTQESINEARMLYILAYDLLGAKPENIGRRPLSADQRYAQLQTDTAPQRSNQLVDQQMNPPAANTLAMRPSLKAMVEDNRDYDFLVYPTELPGGINNPNATVPNPYFFVPENTTLLEYWDRVEDRLYKIRHCLNILGISQPLPLFEPPIDPMALVRAVAAGASLNRAIAGLNVPIPHYRFEFMLRKAQELAQKLSQFGNDLLNALEKKDAEELSLLQNRQEGMILNLTRGTKLDQIQEAKFSRQTLEESLTSTTYQRDHYQRLITKGLTPLEGAQIAMMLLGSGLMISSGVVKTLSAIAHAFPKVTLGVFSTGVTTGGDSVGNAIDKTAEALETSGDAISMLGDALGIFAQHERSKEDWTLQEAMANSEIKQLGLQIQGAILQETMAQRELAILDQQIAHNDSVTTFMRDKFANAQLYQWMASRLSDLYYRTYQMAFDMAKAAEKAFQFERGIKETEASFISGSYWDSQRKGLLAGDHLAFDLDRMEKAYIDSNRRGFEITKAISLLDLDPVALLRLKTKGLCEFSFTEGLFDYDFPGHYCRQIRTLSLAFDFGDEAQPVMATLTQLNHKTVLEPDSKAVKYLFDPKDQPPETLRNGWKANQQIALSHVEDGEKNNGLFELRFDDDRYLPFENTGAVSTWRLELNGQKTTDVTKALRDVVITLKYTAEQGGPTFTSAVKGLLKPYPTARFLDIAEEFPEEWAAFIDGEDDDLVLPMSRDLLPNMSSSKITGIFASYDLAEPGNVSLVLNRDKNLTLRNGKFLQTTGLSINSRGSNWTLTVNGEKEILNSIGLVLSYKARVN
jgi:hypothetical protein